MKRGLSQTLSTLMKVICVVFILFHLYTAYFGVLNGNGQKTVHLGFILLVCFLQDIINEKKAGWSASQPSFLCHWGFPV